MKNLCNLNNEAFGSIAALQDDFLFSCFQEYEAYNALINFLAIGKKGDGKISIFKMIIQPSDPEVFTVGYNLSDYPWPHHAIEAKMMFQKTKGLFKVAANIILDYYKSHWTEAKRK